MTRLKSRRWQVLLAAVLVALSIITLLAIRSQTDTLAVYRPIGEARAAWGALGWGSYRLTLAETGVWAMLNTEVLVEYGSVVAARSTCQPGLIPAGCVVSSLNEADLTVPGLLDSAESRTEATTVTLEGSDPYILTIVHNDPEVLDDEWSLRATAVEVSPGATLPPLLPDAAPVDPLPDLVVPDAADLAGAIDEAEAAWLESGIESYAILVEQADETGVLTVWVVIEGGSVKGVDARCAPVDGAESCAITRLTLGQYRVPDIYGTGLFAAARAAAEADTGDQPPVELHPDLHYPVIIRTETQTITVLALQPLED